MQPEVGAVLYLQIKPRPPKLAAQSTIAASVFGTSDGPRISEEDDFIVHTVQPKETVYAISKKYAVATDDI
jgi:LysM repeat protein